MDAALQAVLSACQRLIERRNALDDDLADRDAALIAWWQDSGVPKVKAGDAVREAMRAAGWTDEQIARAGVSGPSVRVALDRPRRRSTN